VEQCRKDSNVVIERRIKRTTRKKEEEDVAKGNYKEEGCSRARNSSGDGDM